MDLGIKGKRAFVAGSSSGIGRACAELFVREGCEVFLTARGQEKLESAARELGAAGGRVAYKAADLSTAAGVDAAFDAAEAEFGGIDILVNNAGGPKPGPFDALTDADWQHAFELNLMSTVRLTRRALDGMRERRWGRIVNITSVSVKQPIDNLMLSNSLRMAVVGFAKTLSNEVGRHNVTVNTVGPGYTHTERLDDLARAMSERQGIKPDQVYERWMSDVPLARVGTPEEIAAMVVFLASEAASYVNGITVTVDGGRVRTAL